MKICRFASDRDETLYGLYDPSRPDDVLIVEGDLFGAWRVADRRATIKRFLPPVVPAAIFALGLNYGKHAAETGSSSPFVPVVFMKAPTSAIGHGESILLPAAGPEKVDFEGELAVIIGKQGKNIPKSEALDYVLGYTCANDVSARDWQTDKAFGQKGQWIRGKSFDTFCPLGPVLVTREDIAHPNRLHLRTLLNGRIVQDAGTDNMIFDIPAIISDLSRSMTLLPGTVILTGTPEGVGFTRQPPVYLHEGDHIAVEIEGIGTLDNPVRRETEVP
jgi:2-keto-4-pentenoate hydratase/2-oxohepta-3-ene-1,7-dioic acid hydratase in catechol pathway